MIGHINLTIILFTICICLWVVQDAIISTKRALGEIK